MKQTTELANRLLPVLEFQIQLQKGFKPIVVAKAAAATEDEGRKKLITLCVYHSENCARASYTVFQVKKNQIHLTIHKVLICIDISIQLCA